MVGCSTLTTSAPNRASSCVVHGNACICSTVSTRKPSSGLPYLTASSLTTSPNLILQTYRDPFSLQWGPDAGACRGRLAMGPTDAGPHGERRRHEAADAAEGETPA